MSCARRIASALFVILLGLASLPARDALEQAQPKSDAKTIEAFYPMKVGTKWTYAISGKNDKMIVEATKEETVGDFKAVRLEGSLNGNVLATEVVGMQKDGIYRYQYGDQVVKPALRYCKLPARKGESWEQEITINDQKAKVKCETTIENVKVPAGEFKDAVVVKVEVDDNGQKVLTTYYFAENVGIVKQAVEIGEIKFVLELEKVDFPK